MSRDRRVGDPNGWSEDAPDAPDTRATVRADSGGRRDGTETVRTAAPLVLDRYALTKRMGTGAFGTVWMARDERLERDVAVKILARDLIADGRFEREARAAARLSHPGIVTLYEAAVDDEGAYLVSELVRGSTFGSLLAEGKLSDRDIVEIGVALCDALAHAHEHGVVHRDVKPSNVLVPRSGRSRTPCKLTDFGVARLIDSDSLTLTGDVIGTLNYMAPEQAAGLEAGEPADLFSLALVLYEALSGVNPLRDTATTRRSRQLIRLPPLRRQRRELPGPMCDAIDRALRPRIEERGSITELGDALQAAVGQVGEDAGIVTGALQRVSLDEDEEDARVTRLFSPRTLIARRDGSGAPADADRRGTRVDRGRAGRADDGELPDGDPSRLIWQARALAAACAAGAAAWLDHTVLAAHGALTVPIALVALVAGCLTLLLPRIGWLALAGYVAVAAAVQGATGIAALVAIAALVPMVLLPASPTLWAPVAVAPALGLLGLAGAWPAAAGWAHRPWRRMMLGAIGWLWVALTADLLGRTLYEPRPPRTAPRTEWRGSLGGVVDHLLTPLVHSGQLAGAAVWAVAALLVPWIVRRRNPVVDVVLAILWGAALAVVTPIAITAAHGSAADARAPSAIAGAVAAVALALGPLAIDRTRRTLRPTQRVP